MNFALVLSMIRDWVRNLRQHLGLLLGAHGISGFSNVVFSFIATLATLMIVYRLRFFIEFMMADNKPFGQTNSIFTLNLWAASFLHDILTIILFCIPFMIYLGVKQILKRQNEKSNIRRSFWKQFILKTLITIFLIFLLTEAALLTASHHQLVFTMNSGLTYEALVEFFQVLSIQNFLAVMTMADIIFLLTPLGLFSAFFYLTGFFRRMRNYFFFSAISSYSLIILLFFSTESLKGVPRELYYNPILYLIRDVNSAIGATPVRLSLKSVNSMSTGMQLTGDIFANKENSFSTKGYSERKAWNIVFIILESNGSLYIFDKDKYGKGKIPMPFLFELSKKSMFFSNHYSSNNSSPRAIFSMFSGLYENPKPDFFATRKDVHVPHMADFFPEHKSRFLVTPADLDWYFPKWHFKNRNFTDLYDYLKLPFVKQKAGPALIGDEINVSNFFREFDVSDFFIKKIQETQKPFFGIYYTFAGHWPYHDYGEKNRVVPPESSVNRYVNNLYVQDLVIEKIYKGLEQTGLLKNTILIIVGDHSEAFYQHPGNRTHSQESYNENIKSPALIWQPELFVPQEIKEPTSHVDILPTLLDGVRAQYNPVLFQGESILRKSRVRKYIFSYGNENAISVIDRQNIKMTLKNKTGECRRFNLQIDPAEKKWERCSKESEMYKSANLYMTLQPELLASYNNTWKAGKTEFKGFSHFKGKQQNIIE